ncbi:hypothetical protein [Thermoflavifilum thermophilum]|nr:hypothetical protein [Thermoflavifilum thermophilum]
MRRTSPHIRITRLMLWMWLGLCSGCFLFKSSTRTSQVPQAPPAPAPPPRPAVQAVDTAEKNIPAAAPFHVAAFAKLIRKPVYHIALFCPLYLDSMQNESSTNAWLTRFPDYFVPGLEFYEGVKVAMDSLRSMGARLVIKVYDTHSASLPITKAVEDSFLQKADLILGMLSYQELQTLGAFSRQHQVNLVSATLPNDAGITGNPFLIIVNSTLAAHAHAILQYVLTNFNNVHLTLWSQPSSDDNTIAQLFLDVHRQHPQYTVMPMQQVVYDTSWSISRIASQLDVNQNNVCIFTTLDPAVALNMAYKMASLTDRYQINMIGMPTWDQIHTWFTDSSLYGLPVFYSSPFVTSPQSPAARYLQQKFMQLYQTRDPSPYAWKGFDIGYRFVWLMLQYGIYFNARINDPRANMLIPYQFEPVYKKVTDSIPDYFENRKIFFMKIYGGRTYPAGSINAAD